MGIFINFIPIRYRLLNPQTPISVNKISQTINKAATITLAIK